MILYVYHKCSTCQAALCFLKEHDLVATIKEIVEQPPTVSELEKMLRFQEGNLKKLMNTSGMLYRSMGLAEKLPSMCTEEVLSLLSQNGMLVKRPFLLTDNFGLLGFREEEWRISFKGFYQANQGNPLPE